MEVDELYTLKNAYWMGNYEEAIAEAKSLRLKTDALRAERDVYTARSNVGLGNFDVRVWGHRVDRRVSFTGCVWLRDSRPSFARSLFWVRSRTPLQPLSR
jgi:hypothetical protein